MFEACDVPLLRRIATPRLTLEPQIAAHAPEMFALLQDPTIYRYENEAPSSVDWLHERFRRLESRTSADGQEQWLNWVARLPGTGLVGFVQATLRRCAPAAIAYVLGSRYWGRGYATEVVGGMLDELVEYYDVNRFSAVLKRDNVRSVRLLERLGFALASTASGATDAPDDEPLTADEILMVRSGRVCDGRSTRRE
jgi:RimJ/RimL family protein N-acetyltransferase